jgi:ABC-type antimicrobial peptide transport system permease subunit
VLQRSIIMMAIGGALGLGAAMSVTRYLEGMLFGLTPLDPATFLLLSAVFGAVAVVAAFLPAQRATTVDPLVSLRHE